MAGDQFASSTVAMNNVTMTTEAYYPGMFTIGSGISGWDLGVHPIGQPAPALPETLRCPACDMRQSPPKGDGVAWACVSCGHSL